MQLKDILKIKPYKFNINKKGETDFEKNLSVHSSLTDVVASTLGAFQYFNNYRKIATIVYCQDRYVWIKIQTDNDSDFQNCRQVSMDLDITLSNYRGWIVDRKKISQNQMRLLNLDKVRQFVLPVASYLNGLYTPTGHSPSDNDLIIRLVSDRVK